MSKPSDIKTITIDGLNLPPMSTATVNAEYNEAGEIIDPNLPDAPVSPGNTLQEITVLHVYRGDVLDGSKPKTLIGYYSHPNPEAVDAKRRELEGAPSNWHIDQVRYVRSDLALKAGSR